MDSHVEATGSSEFQSVAKYPKLQPWALQVA